MSAQHVVDNAVFEISFGSADDAFGKQAGLGVLVKNRLLRIAEKVFDEFENEGHVYRIEQLEIDLGDISYTGYPDELEARLESQLRAALNEMLAPLRIRPGGSDLALTVEQTELEMLQQFLLTGRLPWYATASSIGTIDQLFSRVVASSGPALAEFLRTSSQRKMAVRRMARQFFSGLLEELAETLSPARSEFPAALVSNLAMLWSDRRFLYATERELVVATWERVFSALLSKPHPHDPVSVVGIVVRGLAYQVEVGGGDEIMESLASQAMRFDQQERLAPELRAFFAAIVDKRPEQSAPHDQTRRSSDPPATTGQESSADSALDVEALTKQESEASASRLKVESSPVDEFREDRLTTTVGPDHDRLAAASHEIDSEVVFLAYELDARFRERLAGASGGRDTTESGLIAVIDRLASEYPWHLKRIYLELQSGTITVDTVATGLTVAELPHLVNSLLLITRQSPTSSPTELIGAIDRHASLAGDQKEYYRKVLELLVRGELIDFEAILGDDGNSVGRNDVSAVAPNEDEPGLTREVLAEDRESTALSEDRANTRQSGRGSNMDPIEQDSTSSEVFSSSDDIEPANLVPEDAPTSSAMELERRARLESSSVDELMHFLISGDLISDQASGRWVRVLKHLMVTQPGRLRQMLDPALGLAQVGEHLIEVMPDHVLTRLLFLMRPGEHASVQRDADVITDAFMGLRFPLGIVTTRLLKWRFIFSYLFTEGLQYERHAFTRRFSEYLGENSKQVEPSEFRHRLSQQVLIDSQPASRHRHEEISLILSEERENGAILDTEPDLAFRRPDQPDLTQDFPENTHIENAGLVLAAPYLQRLFSALELTETSAFRDFAAAERAVHFLQFMVNMSTDSPEHLLVLNKVLCGIGIQIPVTREIGTTDQEKELVESLIQGMIRNWTAIGNTSVTGFRESFLQRSGTLSFQNDSWHLQVEPRAFDMLLDAIPWTYTTVKLPWMDYVLHVDWR